MVARTTTYPHNKKVALVSTPVIKGHSRIEKSFNEIYRLPEFKRDYEFKSIQVAENKHFNYYQRRPDQ